MDTSKLGSGRFRRVEWVVTTASTNSDLSDRARAGDASPRVLVADEQTAGRGRRDRTWDMPAGDGLLISFHVPWPGGNPGIVATALGIATIEAVRDLGAGAWLKWPNDVLVEDGRKIAGMLGERVAGPNHVGVVVGLGLNIGWPINEPALPDATCLNELVDDPIDRDRLTARLIAEFDQELDRLERFGSDVVINRYRDRCATLGAEVIVTIAESELRGRAVDVDGQGRLILECDGSRRTVDAGDVVHVRPH